MGALAVVTTPVGEPVAVVPPVAAGTMTLKETAPAAGGVAALAGEMT